MFPIAALAAVSSTSHPTGWLIALVALAVVGFGTVLTYTGTNASPMDQNLGAFGAYVDQELAGTQIVSTAGPTAINISHGKVIVTYAGVAAMTLALPTAGSPANGGNDAQPLKFIDASGHAHTLTTPATGINTTHHIATSGGAIGDTVELIGYNGTYLCNPAATNWTIS